MTNKEKPGVLEQYLAEAGGQAESPPPLHFDFTPYDRFGTLPMPDWLIEGVLVDHESNLIFGASNTFKTMLAVDLACSVAAGRPWHGCAVKRGRVLYVATEGRNGVCRLRIRGWMDRHDIAAEDRRNIEALKGEIFITDPEDVDRLISDLTTKGGGYKLIVLDVAAGTMRGSESDDETAKAWVAGIERLIAGAAAVLAITHSGWADQTRARGHTHIWGSFNARLKTEGDKDARTGTLSVNRFKDADSVGLWGFRFEYHVFGDDDRTLIPVLDEDVKEIAKSKKTRTPRGPIQHTLMDALDDALRTCGEASPGFTGMPTHGQVTTLQAWERASIPHLGDVEPKRRVTTFNRTAKSLIDGGYVGRHNDYVWRKT
jgi:hypothetical protein